MQLSEGEGSELITWHNIEIPNFTRYWSIKNLKSFPTLYVISWPLIINTYHP